MSVEEKAILNRCGHLGFRCFTGFDRRDKEKKKPILEGKALAEWQELLEKRFPQPVSGGTPFVLKIAQVVKDKKTQEGLDLTGKDAILEHLAKWCERKCKGHSIDPGSEAMQALLQQGSCRLSLARIWYKNHTNERMLMLKGMPSDPPPPRS